MKELKNGSYTNFVINVWFLVQLHFEHIHELKYYVEIFSNVNFNIANISSKLCCFRKLILSNFFLQYGNPF